jgi:hypothetical protein
MRMCVANAVSKTKFTMRDNKPRKLLITAAGELATCRESDGTTAGIQSSRRISGNFARLNKPGCKLFSIESVPDA